MSIVDRVKELNFPHGSYAVFGSGPLAAHGIREARDIDIVVLTDFFHKLQMDTSWKEGKLRDLHKFLERDGITVYDSWAPDSWDIPQMIKEAEIIDGVPFVRLGTVLEWKKIRDLPKDKHDVELIEKYLANKK